MTQQPTATGLQPMASFAPATASGSNRANRSQAFSDPQVRAYISNLRGQLNVLNKKASVRDDVLKRLVLPSMASYPQLQGLRGNGPHPSPQYMKLANRLATNLTHNIINNNKAAIVGGYQQLSNKWAATLQKYNNSNQGWSVVMRMASRQIKSWWNQNKEAMITQYTPLMAQYYGSPAAQAVMNGGRMN